MPINAILSIEGIRKEFGRRPAVTDLWLAVPPASIFGLVGPNGSGKTTTLRMCCGLLRPDRGAVHVDGVDVWADLMEAKRRLGVVPDPLLLFERLTGWEQLLHTGAMRAIPTAEAASRAEELLSIMGLTASANQQVHSYSHGMRKKLSLAVALLHRPRVLLLDEPFEGVDPGSVVVLRQVLDRFRATGGSVVISSHAMDLVQRHCDHVAIMSLGNLLAAGPIGEVTAGRSLEEAFIDLTGTVKLDDDDLSWLSSQPT